MNIHISISKKDIMFLLVGLMMLGGSAMLYAGTVTIPNTFSSATTAKASEVNANFTAIKTAVDDNANSKAPLASPTFTGTTTTTNLVKTCPSGFSSVEVTASNDSILRQIGCIQNTVESSSATCQTAILDCWDTYGGRLPTYNEAYTAVQRNASSLTDEGAAAEWLNGAFYDTNAGTNYVCSVMATSANSYQPAGTIFTSNQAYRCFIPS